ncbi:EF hand domain protein, partial [Reticulomyxa filosa]
TIDLLQEAAGQKGTKELYEKLKNAGIEITAKQQRILFEEEVKMTEDYTKTLCKKYYNVDFDKLHPLTQDTLVDMCYRGDFKPKDTKTGLKEVAEKNDVNRLFPVVANRSVWHNVPYERFKQRASYYIINIPEQQRKQVLENMAKEDPNVKETLQNLKKDRDASISNLVKNVD